MQIATRWIARTLVAAPVGRIDHLSAADFEAALMPLLKQAGDDGALVLDFAGIDYISSVGLRVLMVAAKQMREERAAFVVTGLSSVVDEIFRISRFDRLLVVTPTLDAALAHVADAAAARPAPGAAPTAPAA